MRHSKSGLWLVGLMVLGVTACTYAPRYDDVPAYRSDYYYYPGIGVYFHLYSGDYFYRDGDRWLRTRVLPPRIVLDQRLRRPLVIKDPAPYRHNADHRERYRPPPNVRRDPRYDRPEREHNEPKYAPRPLMNFSHLRHERESRCDPFSVGLVPGQSPGVRTVPSDSP